MTTTDAIAGEGRTLDFLEIDGSKALGGEVKSGQEIVNSVENLKTGGMEGNFKDDTSKVGQQRVKERKVNDVLEKTPGGLLVFTGTDVRTGAKITLKVDPKDYRSTVVSYDQIRPN